VRGEIDQISSNLHENPPLDDWNPQLKLDMLTHHASPLPEIRQALAEHAESALCTGFHLI